MEDRIARSGRQKANEKTRAEIMIEHHCDECNRSKVYYFGIIIGRAMAFWIDLWAANQQQRMMLAKKSPGQIESFRTLKWIEEKRKKWALCQFITRFGHSLLRFTHISSLWFIIRTKCKMLIGNDCRGLWRASNSFFGRFINEAFVANTFSFQFTVIH